jgi:hypothetical protein
MRLFLPSTSSWLRLAGLLILSLTSRLVHAQLYYVDMSQQKLSVSSRSLFVEQVQDCRPTQSTLGMVYRGLQNRQAAAFFQRGLAPELTTWLQQQLPARPGQRSIVLCVRQLRVSEILNGVSEQASADLAADVYVRQPDGYHFVRSVADQVSERALETTALHASHIALLLERCLLQLTDNDWSLAAGRPVLALTQLPTDKPLARFRPAILRAARPRRGIYLSFDQFLANRPDTVSQLWLDTLRPATRGWEGTVLLRPKVRGTNGLRATLRDAWGFSDGRQAYVRQFNSYHALTRQGDFYTFVGFAPLDVEAVNQRTARYAAIGGMTGALIASTGSDSGDSSGQPTACALDMRTGQAAPFPAPGQVLPTDTAFIYVYRPMDNSAGGQRLLVDGREVGQLGPGQFLELACPLYGRLVRLSTGAAGGPTLLLVPNAATANYVKLLPATPHPFWQWMPLRQGEAEVDALEKQRP